MDKSYDYPEIKGLAAAKRYTVYIRAWGRRPV